MSGNVNTVILVGTIGKDPEVRTTPQNLKVANFSIATNENWKDKNGNKQQKTQWHRLVLWKGLAEIAEKYLKKGACIYVSGKLDYRKYTDSKGVEKYSTEIVVSDLQMLSGKGESGGSQQESAPQDDAFQPPTDDLPF